MNTLNYLLNGAAMHIPVAAQGENLVKKLPDWNVYTEEEDSSCLVAPQYSKSKAMLLSMKRNKGVAAIAASALIAMALALFAAPASAQPRSTTSVLAAEQAATAAANRLDFAAMEPFAKTACDGGSPQGCGLLLRRYDGRLFYLPNNPQPYKMGESRPLLAATVLATLCDRGEASECVDLAERLRRGEGAGQWALPRDRVRAASLFKRACELGSARACLDGGAMYAAGRDVPADPRLAVMMLEKACESNNGDGCYDAASLYSQGKGIAKDDSAATRLFRRACEKSSLGCVEAGKALLTGTGVPRDVAQAIAAMTKGCDGRYGDACHALGQLYAGAAAPGVARDPQLSRKFQEMACNLKFARGCGDLGSAAERGMFGSPDARLAAISFDSGCELRDFSSCLGAARIMASGKLGTTDLKYARKRLMDAASLSTTPEQASTVKSQSLSINTTLCNAGDGISCVIVGQAYQQGDGVNRDAARALSFHQKACDAGTMLGCSAAGAQLVQPGATAADQARAVEFFRRSCNGRSADGCYRLGIAYAKGLGVAPDRQAAAANLRKALELNPSAELATAAKNALAAVEQ